MEREPIVVEFFLGSTKMEIEIDPGEGDKRLMAVLAEWLDESISSLDPSVLEHVKCMEALVPLIRKGVTLKLETPDVALLPTLLRSAREHELTARLPCIVDPSWKNFYNYLAWKSFQELSVIVATMSVMNQSGVEPPPLILSSLGASISDLVRSKSIFTAAARDPIAYHWRTGLESQIAPTWGEMWKFLMEGGAKSKQIMTDVAEELYHRCQPKSKLI